MTYEQLVNFLNITIASIADQPITIGDILLVPTFLIVGFLLTKWLVKIITRRLTSKNTDPNVIHLLQRVFYVVALTIIVITTLDVINVPITAFAFLSGAIAIGFGFGAQNIINNFISGWILMWERPIRIGDFLEVGTAKGVVETINTRSTRIRRNDGVHMLIPNSQLLENTVTNWTLIDGNARSSVSVGVAYGSDVLLVKKLIQQVLDEHEAILATPQSTVLFDDFADSSLVFNAIFWVCAESETRLRQVRSDIRFRIYEVFEQHDVVIAFPQRDLHIDGEIVLKRSLVKK